MKLLRKTKLNGIVFEAIATMSQFFGLLKENKKQHHI